MAILPLYLEVAPETVNQRFDLFDTIDMETLPEKGIAGGVQYDTPFCGIARTAAGFCVTPTTKTGDDGIDQTVGEPIVVYHNFTCRLIGSEDPKARAEKALDLGSSRAVEDGFALVIGDASTDLGGPVSVKFGIAILEQFAGANYGGRAVIHLPRHVATLAAAENLVVEVGGHLETHLGSLVIAGAGYNETDEPSAAASGAEWGYVTGAVHLYQSAIAVNEMALERDSGGYTNEFAALVERVYVPTFECIAGAVEMKVTEP